MGRQLDELSVFFWRPAIYVTSLCYCFMLLANKLMKINCPVCNVGVLWPNGWTDHDLGMQVGLGPGHIVLDGDPRISWPNGWMDQDAVRLGPSSPPIFSRLSVTRRYCVKTTARSTVQFVLLDSKMCLVLYGLTVKGF